MSRRRLDSARAIVTGASAGIGRAIALELAQRGASLILTARRSTELEAVAEAAAAVGAPRPIVVAGDITDSAVHAALIERAQQMGGLDLLVNNAGVSAHGPFASASGGRLAEIMAVNFQAPAALTRLAIPLLRRARDAAVLNVGSILAYHGAPHNSEYCASKAALRVWSQALRAELAADGIDVVLLSPGTTDTQFFANLIEKQGELPWRKPQGLAPEAVARAAVRGLERRRREVVPGWRAKAFVAGARFAPGLMDRVMRRYGGSGGR